jgi:UDP-N-acetylmuramate dehydrogenase
LESWGIRGAVLTDVPMKRYTSMRVGGPAKSLLYPVDEQDLLATIGALRKKGVPYRFLGNGTNIIVHDKGFAGAVIRTTRIRSLHHEKTKDGALVKVSGGASLRRFIEDNANRGLAGLERLYWIPGTVGGGIKMNAGSFGASISDVLESVTIVNGNGMVRSVDKKDLSFDYRRSPVKSSECVISAVFRLKSREKKEILEEMKYVLSERKKRHPLEFPSSGSIFKSVDGQGAWQFVEKAGLRGLRIGGAAVSEKHTNFIVNLGHATAEDIKNLMERVKKEVFEKSGVLLEEEVELWGFEGAAKKLGTVNNE